ncbi:hypothetical protein E1212_13785 [Jiangella ureilytica]|uniref:Calpain catalytic domain-containing protein n=1 Tax=Jiangella ureilytica TaxID=2530374 RepID=A0A4R4RMA9_9ACTN|nr:C2 family cysteine protease [Jiangella ureilytica]TDC50817.1 hypothetical protein E1212_13785 [Jiangella ureilytica]
MGERPVRAAADALAALRAAAATEFGALRSATVGRAAGMAGADGVVAAVDDAADRTLHAVDAEARRLRGLLRDSPPAGRRPPFLAPSGTPAGGPSPVPGLTVEPEVTAGVEYAGRPLTHPVAVDVRFARQGGISDCHLVAALGAVADRAPELLPRATAGDDVVLVDVPGRRYRLRATLPVDGGSGRLAYAHSPDHSTLVPYVEKAFAVYAGGYPVLGEGGLPVEALHWITGRPCWLLRLPRAPDEALTALITSRRPAVACSRPFDDDPADAALAVRYGLSPVGHAYAVCGLDPEGRVLLHNPWGLRHPEPLPLGLFRRLFTRIDWCETDDDD